MESLEERLKHYYSLDEESFAELIREPSSLSFPDISGNEAVKKAKSRIEQSIEKKEKVLLYGDYDTDGILGTSIFHNALLERGMDASYFIPSRYSDGYGLTLENAKKIADSAFSLVILIDNGVSCLEEVGYLRSKGVDVLIFDHHELPEKLPDSLALIHPIPLGIGKAGGFNISAGFVSYLFSLVLTGREDRYRRSLAGITTLSDMMPMKGMNRTLVALLLRDLRKEKYPEITLLCDKKRIDEKVLGMLVIPSINALGRMEEGHKARQAVSYFSYREANKRVALANWMKKVNEERKALTKEAGALVRYQPGAPGIVANLPLKEGLNGLLANKLMKQYKVPVAIFSSSYADPNVLVGSIRSEEGFDVLECMKTLAPYCLRFGGHSHAGGIAILKQDYPSFSKVFLAYCREHPFTKEEPPAIPLLLSEATMDSFRTIRKFGPFGEEHEEPLFMLSGLPTDSFQYGKEGKCLLTPLGYNVRLVDFEHGKKDFVQKEKASFYVRFEINEFRGNASLELRVVSTPNK